MKTLFVKIGRRGQILLAASIVFLWIIIHHEISKMDERFFQPSISGIKGLVLYEFGDYSGAAEAYRAHLQDAFQTERTTDDPAWDALLRRDFKTAKQISQKELDTDSTAVGPLLTLGEIELEEGTPDRALEFFNRVLRKETDQFDALLLSSVAYARSRSYGKAIDSLNRALRYFRIESRITSFLQALETTGDLARLPKGEKPLCLLAHYYRYLRIFDPTNGRLAIQYAESAIRVGDHPDDAYLTLGIVYDKEGKEENALSAFLKAIETNPSNAEPYIGAAEIYSNRGNLAREYQMMKTSYESAPTDSFYITRFSSFLIEKLGDYQQALSLNQKFLESHPEDVNTLQWVGYLHSYMGDEEQAINYYQKALLLQPENPSLYDAVGHSLRGLGEVEEAKTAYRTSLTLSGYRPQPHVGLAEIYERQGSYKDAIQEYEQAFRFGERDNVALTNLCILYHRASQFERAARCLEHVLAVDPRNQIAEHMLSYTLKNTERGGSDE